MTSPDSADAGKASANAEAEPKKESETTDASAAKAEQEATAVVSEKSEKVEQSESSSDPDKSKPVEAAASDDAAPAEADGTADAAPAKADGAADANEPAGDADEQASAEAEPVAVKKAPRGRTAKRKEAVVLPRPNKQELISKFQRKGGDTGSSEVQVALLSARISHLTSHLKVHPKDKHTERGLLLLVNQRRKLLDYLNGKDPSSYRSLIGQLNLRR